jgi:hypothetical protein
MIIDSSIASHFAAGVLRAAHTLGAVIGDAATKAHTATRTLTSWPIHQDRKARAYARKLRKEGARRPEDIAQSLRDAWSSI